MLPRRDHPPGRAPVTRRSFLGLGALGASALATGSLAGCATGDPVADVGPALGAAYDGRPVTLSYWTGFTGGDGPSMRGIVDAYNASQDLVTVEMNTVRWAQYYQRVAAAVHAGKGPDVGALHVDQLATQAARQTLNPLDDTVLADLGASAEDYPEAVWERGVFRDQRFGVPLDVHSLAAFTNRGLLSQAGLGELPATGEEYAAYLEQAVAAGIEAPFWMPNLWPAHLIFLSLLWQFGGEPYAEDGTEATFDSDAGRQALEWMVRQIDEGYSPPNVAVDTQYTAFKNGENAVTWDGIWQINDLLTTAPDLDWSMQPVPQIGPEPGVWASSHQLVLFKSLSPDEDKLRAGKDFLRYVIAESAGWAAAGMIPASEAARQEQEFLDSPQAAINEAVPTMHFLPPVPALGDVQAQTLEIAVSEAVLGRLDPAEALSGAAGRATSLMQANLRKFGGTS